MAALQQEQHWIEALCLALIMLPNAPAPTPAPSTNFCDERKIRMRSSASLVAVAAGITKPTIAVTMPSSSTSKFFSPTDVEEVYAKRYM